MEYLHNKGIVHFDMKSANLLLGHRDRRVICKVLTLSVMPQEYAVMAQHPTIAMDMRWHMLWMFGASHTRCYVHLRRWLTSGCRSRSSRHM